MKELGKTAVLNLSDQCCKYNYICSVRRMQFASFTCNKAPEALATTPGKNQRPASPLAAPPPVPTESGENAVESEVYKEYALLCLTNLGDCLILSIPELKRQLNAAAIRREDIK